MNSGVIENAYQITDNSPMLDIQRIRQSSNHTGRLPKHLKPLIYEIDLDLSRDDPYFTGVTTIKFTCINNTNEIVFHGGNFSLVKLAVHNSSQNGTLMPYKTISYMDEHQMFIIHLNDVLKKNSTYHLHVEYKEEFSFNLAGIQKNTYLDEGIQK